MTLLIMTFPYNNITYNEITYNGITYNDITLKLVLVVNDFTYNSK